MLRSIFQLLRMKEAIRDREEPRMKSSGVQHACWNMVYGNWVIWNPVHLTQTP